MTDKGEMTALVQELAGRAVPCSSIADLIGMSERYVRMLLKDSKPRKVSETLPENILARCAEFRKRKVNDN